MDSIQCPLWFEATTLSTVPQPSDPAYLLLFEMGITLPLCYHLFAFFTNNVLTRAEFELGLKDHFFFTPTLTTEAVMGLPMLVDPPSFQQEVSIIQSFNCDRKSVH